LLVTPGIADTQCGAKVFRAGPALRDALSAPFAGERAIEICRRYVEAYDPATPVESYVGTEPGRIVEVEAEVVHCWDYADDAMMPT